ncbi:unnamed protein product [Paramecium sonneborni]|uniref:Uncharacterized protein n=1 Tax=Paramecium sonneborni TaxID=65129 RepID=A0A8S1PLC8_9CILI|nr:unnamed protein product [Paramecium sonneborni]
MNNEIKNNQLDNLDFNKTAKLVEAEIFTFNFQLNEFDEQFQQKKIKIIEIEVKTEIYSEEEEIYHFSESINPDSESSRLSFIGKRNRALQLKILLEQKLGEDKIQQSIKILYNEFTSKRLIDLEKYDQNFYQTLLPFLSLKECENFVPLLFQLIILSK